jgi:deoxycytidylate deaminase
MQYNKFRTHLNAPIGHRIHAEIAAVLNAGKHDLSDASIFVYREVTGMVRATARPCEACTEALRDNGILKFFYTTPNGFAFEQINEVRNDHA